MGHICPECGRAASPVYCAASTDAAPLLLAHTVAQAARALGISETTLRNQRLEPWRDGWRIVPAAARARTCAVLGCGRRARAAGLCEAHYARQRRGSNMSKPIKERG